MKTIFINGEHLCYANMDGMKRYMIEILSRIDKALPELKINIVLYHHDNEELIGVKFENIKDISIPGSGKIYKFKNVPAYIKRMNGIQATLSNDLINVKGGIYTIHDIIPLYKIAAFPLKDKIRMLLMYLISFHFSKIVVTDCKTTARDLVRKFGKVYPRLKEKIIVSTCGYEHMEAIAYDDSIFSKDSRIEKNNYYLAIGNYFPHKNFKIINELAKNNKDDIFVIAGKMQPIGNEKELTASNIIYLGYITDEEYKSLLKNCKAFIHPSKLEGFGIPPLEALSLGTDAIVAKASCLPEIYGNTVHYFDPDNGNILLDKLLGEKVDEADGLFLKSSWERASRIWQKILVKCANE